MSADVCVQFWKQNVVVSIRAVLLTMNNQNNSVRGLPKLESDEHYETWKKDVQIWQVLTDLDKKKQALAIHLSLSGRARVASSELSVAALNKDDGVETLIKKLDKVFLKDEGRRQFAVFHELYNLRRDSEKNVNEFIVEFEHSYFKFSEQKMTFIVDITINFRHYFTSQLANEFSYIKPSFRTVYKSHGLRSKRRL